MENVLGDESHLHIRDQRQLQQRAEKGRREDRREIRRLILGRDLSMIVHFRNEEIGEHLQERLHEHVLQERVTGLQPAFRIGQLGDIPKREHHNLHLHR